MGYLTTNIGANYSDSDAYYSKNLQLVFPGKKRYAGGIGVKLYQLYAPNSIITNNHKYDLSGSIAEINFIFSFGNANEHSFDIVDADNQRRLIIVTSPENPASKFLMYYCKGGIVYKYECQAGVSLGNSLINLKINLSNGTVIDNKMYVFISTVSLSYPVTVTDVTDDPSTPGSYKLFNQKYGVRIQGDANSENPGAEQRFKIIRLSIDDKNISCIQCIPPDLFDWAAETFFTFSGPAHVASELGEAAQISFYNIFFNANSVFNP